MPLRKDESICSSSSYGQIVGQTRFLILSLATYLGEKKNWIQTNFSLLENGL